MNYEMIQWNFENGLWNKQAVLLAVKKGVITKNQAEEIFNGKNVKS